MDLTSTKSGSSSDITQTSSLSAKLKRLQIEESLLLQRINKKGVPETSQSDVEIGENDATSYQTYSEFKAFLGKTKNSFREIKLLYQDIRASTSSKESLKTLDIDEFKKITLQLENRMKAIKMYLQTELTCLKSAEEQLQLSMNEKPVLINKFKRQPRIRTAKYNEIVPSPVKTIMTSPFKCIEVQQFQEFMTNSANRYGGWNEYHHNIFVNYWKKHFGSQLDTSSEELENLVKNSPAFDSFLYELLPKLQGIHEEEIISHVKWYSKYVYLKERQQRAIDKWRSNRKVMKLAQAESEQREEHPNSYLIRKRTSARKPRNDNADRNNTDELDYFAKDLVPLSQSRDEARFIRKCYSEDVQRDIHISKDIDSSLDSIENLTPKDDEDSIDHTLLHFQKPTKQWCLMINSKDSQVKWNVNNVENIEKLRIPTWRVGL
ncbi:hypothetical protein PYW08_005659 [Mythimna loreyi]|uniref:Uncharacterized protein n=1 Tax=Mythimna loreyi TaxID=667449 RepID=A0ACC2QL94_9NEOP|nr:hypothetical protein PYW08_005659 [Mythimna loreyi]